MQRYFLSKKYQHIDPENIEICDENVHHMLHVMRMKKGEQSYLVFDDQVIIIAEIKQIDQLNKSVLMKETEKEVRTAELPRALTIACGFTKGEKLEWVVQKGTELGAVAFIGFPADRSIVKWDQKKLEKHRRRLEKIAKEAAEQSHRQLQPQLHLMTKKQELLAILPEYDAIIVAYEEAARKGESVQLAEIFQKSLPGQKILCLFGPEGGFSLEEVEDFQSLGGKLCSLGPRILRAETAPLYVLSAASYAWELS